MRYACNVDQQSTVPALTAGGAAGVPWRAMLAVKLWADAGGLTFMPPGVRCGTLLSCRDLRLTGYDATLNLWQVRPATRRLCITCNRSSLPTRATCPPVSPLTVVTTQAC